MDAPVDDLAPAQDSRFSAAPRVDPGGHPCAPLNTRREPLSPHNRPPRKLPQARPTPKRSMRRVGKEAVKAGMAASLAVTMLTGLKIIRPMKWHGPASWLFVGLTLAHTLVYEIPNKRASKR
ncbi:hypothetical protein JCM17960_18320 [Magnetospira thiophila]